MSNRSQSHFLKVYNASDSTVYARWQNYYVNQSVTLSSASWSYFPFVATGIMAATANGGAGVSIEIPATKTALSVFNPAIARGYLCEVNIYEFDSRNENAAPSGSQTTIATYLGEVIEMGGSFTALTVNLGSALAPVGSQAPPRKFTSYQVGAPITI